MKVITFTDLMVRKLKPEEKKYVRGEGNGFTVRIMPSGVKTWLYVYNFDGRRREMNLGIYPEVSPDGFGSGGSSWLELHIPNLLNLFRNFVNCFFQCLVEFFNPIQH